MKELVVTIHRDSNKATVKQIFPDGGITEKHIPLDEVLSVLNVCLVQEEYLQIGELPSGYYKGAIQKSCPGSFRVALIYPGSENMLSYYGEEYVVPFPELLFLFEVKNSKVQEGSVFALKRQKSECKVMAYPFGNVYESGKICWGNTNLPMCAAIKDSEQIVGLFFGGETNNDLYMVNRNVVQKEEFINQKGLILALQNKKVFPISWLVPKNMKLDECVDAFMRGKRG